MGPTPKIDQFQQDLPAWEKACTPGGHHFVPNFNFKPAKVFHNLACLLTKTGTHVFYRLLNTFHTRAGPKGLSICSNLSMCPAAPPLGFFCHSELPPFQGSTLFLASTLNFVAPREKRRMKKNFRGCLHFSFHVHVHFNRHRCGPLFQNLLRCGLGLPSTSSLGMVSYKA